ncbi:MAG: DNA polymerase III subunit delta [Candidatus Jettenia sp.]|uniref:DNA polymerase III subunit delta n=1 Tax=Candidatus Jettenia caeni TaxID=247490 RepID=I3IMA2_9BACT|nr:DNA polymerase III subunit delta [Candidatus Jettenia sp. AMX1]MBC6927727.1 DNA polymerase III subunit delta [Candidatus Jettenia sp.]NUN22071.1 DNA polymerase III subunit delta [Candidatus Jettenia caeni]KAA0251413.1 MAG: DNA polymerase III subunit delta [Candidatus Jettenia sp. AMX1]MCE7879393.1 DNA polymerase III subunit delta [Candidatus Jettenia sp. AMX1]MDL1938342.1 DNA polymerase III subunit delta [Candidatus Jettenia sp. AMX1]
MDIHQCKDKIFPIYVVFGDEEFFIREALSSLKAHLLKDTDPTISLVEFKGDEVAGGIIFDELRTMPFFAGKNKVVIVEEADSFVEKNRQVLEKYVQAPASHSQLILVCDKWDKRTKLATLVDKVGILVECKKLKDHQLPNWIITRTKQYTKKVTTKAAQMIAENAGNNLAILDKHIEKLSIYLGDRTAIDEKDVEALVGIDRNRTIFELTDAVAQRNVTLALKTLSQMLIHGEDSVKIISLLAWQMKRLWRAKQMLNKGEHESKVTSELQVLPFFAKRFFEQVKIFTEKDLTKKYALLLEADVKSKTSSFSMQLLLELLVYKLCV